MGWGRHGGELPHNAAASILSVVWRVSAPGICQAGFRMKSSSFTNLYQPAQIDLLAE
jgi:predicted membrane protein